jgi:hypothetical protein
MDQRHRSYLLRIWRAGNHDAPIWRFWLEDVHTHEHQVFVDLDSLLVFLAAQLHAPTGNNAATQRAADLSLEQDAS